MITSIKNANYSFLFREASEELLALHNAGKLGESALTDKELEYLCQTDEEGNPYVQPFTSLEQYFTRLGTLVSFSDNPIHYLMLPLDEPCLDVNANTREITMPPLFKKYGVGVQGDVIAETLFLRIDRFFDSMDLLETEGYIQWKLKDGTEGASKIPYIDYKSEHSTGKLILVWPLTEDITSQDGTVQFSLRFLKKRDSKIVYSWSSLPCALTIKKALRVSPDYKEFDDAAPLFQLAIENSKHTASGDEVDPASFEAPGYDFGLNAVDYLTPNNDLVLQGQAWIDDQGLLTYRWQHRTLDNKIVTPDIDPAKAKTSYFVKTNDNEPNSKKTYYIEKSSHKPYGYQPVPYADLVEEFNKEQLFERKAYYHILPNEGPVESRPGAVTGTYDLVAIHRLGFDTADSKISVTLPGPEVLEFTTGNKIEEPQKDKEGNPIVDEDGNELMNIYYEGLNSNGTFIDGTGESAKINLTVNVNNDDIPSSAYQSMTYAWFRKTSSEANAEWTPVATNVYDNTTSGQIGKKTDSIELTGANAIPGWYQVIVTSMVNRDTKSIDSAIARVTNLPQAPSLKFPASADNDNYDVVNADSYEGRKVELKIEINEFEGEKDLTSDEFIYEWRVGKVPISELEDDDSFKKLCSGYDTDTLIIDGSNYESDYVLIDCVVLNRLNGQTSTEEAQSGIFMVEF